MVAYGAAGGRAGGGRVLGRPEEKSIDLWPTEATWAKEAGKGCLPGCA